ncbi:MAG: heavy metal translocating P-type ATPase [Spirochaetes bacterium]|nr:heavy metal translocating P-type ATPase [Spirochaetota bacterium]
MRKSIAVKIYGMNCVMCSRSVERALCAVEGIHSAIVNFTTGIAEIQFEDNLVSEKIIQNAIERSGYRYGGLAANIANEEKQNAYDFRMEKIRFSLGIAAGSLVMAFMYFPLPYNFPLPLVLFTISTPIIFFISYPIFTAAFHAMKTFTPTMDVMYALGIGISYLSSMMSTIGILSHDFLYYETPLFLASFLTLGKYLEARARNKTTFAIKRLMALQPLIAHRVVDTRIVDIPLEEVVIGDSLLVKAGEAIPADGVITQGESSVDQSMLTGESVPVFRGVGDSVIGGCINLEGSFIMQATRTAQDTVLSRIIRIVSEAQSSKPTLQTIADRVVGYFIPLILFIAMATFAIWFFALNSSASFAISRLISVLVIACPCALGLATPTAVTVGIGRAAAFGILIKHSEVLELSEKIRIAIFDKTGTLTAGKPKVASVYSDGSPVSEIISIAAGMEEHSAHPVAHAITEFAREQNVSPIPFESVTVHSGLGIVAHLNGIEMCVGNARFLNERGYVISNNIMRVEEEIAQKGNISVLVGKESRALGIFEVSDTIRPFAHDAISLLRKMGITVMMITGDNRRAALSVAKSIGIDKVISEILPEQKASQILALQKDGHRVAFVGDGINDAPALACADIGISLSGSTDIALEAGSVILLNGDLRDVYAMLALGKKVTRRIRQNIFWAIAYNALLIPIAAGGLYPFFGITLKPEFAGLAMALSSLTVVTLSLLLRRYNPHQRNN